MGRLSIAIALFVVASPALAEKLDDIWTMAEARIVVERCPYANVDERVMADIGERSHIDLKENVEDRADYAYRKGERRDQFWPRNQGEMCTRGWIGYGPHGVVIKNLLIFHWPPRKGAGHL